MKLNHLLSLSSLIPALLLVQLPARAVPGWAQTWRHLEVSPSDCTNYVQKAIKKVTGSTSIFVRKLHFQFTKKVERLSFYEGS